MEFIFNSQIGMAFLGIIVLLVVYVLVIGWTRRVGTGVTPPKGTQTGADRMDAAAATRPDPIKTESARESNRKKKQILIQGKDAEIAASVLRRMLSDHDRS